MNLTQYHVKGIPVPCTYGAVERRLTFKSYLHRKVLICKAILSTVHYSIYYQTKLHFGDWRKSILSMFVVLSVSSDLY